MKFTILLLADDHEILRQGLKVLLESDRTFSVVAEASTGREAVKLTLKHRPDVVVLDHSMPQQNGIDATRELRVKGYAGPVIILSGHNHPDLIGEARAAGASGYVVKQNALTELTAAIATCSAGHTYFTTSTAGVPAAKSEALALIARLTPREREILGLLARGRSAKEIGLKLGLSPKTVFVHRKNLTTKLGLPNLADLARLAIRAGHTEL